MAETGHLEATLAELETRRARIDAAIAEIRMMLGQPAGDSGAPGPGSPSPPGGGVPASDAFLGLSIPEATKKHLTAVRKALPTKAIMLALEAGGLRKSAYNTIYGVLRRREVVIGDIINVKGDWALAEWYPGHVRNKGKNQKSTTDEPEPEAAPKDKDKDGNAKAAASH
jgi:hypothetical protein